MFRPTSDAVGPVAEDAVGPVADNAGSEAETDGGGGISQNLSNP